MLSKFYWLLIAAKHSNTGTYIAFETPLLVVFACSVGGWAMSRQRLVKDAFFVSFLLSPVRGVFYISVTTVCILFFSPSFVYCV